MCVVTTFTIINTCECAFFLWHSGPRIPGLNKRFGEPDLDSPQLTSCLRIKWYTGDAPDNKKKKKWQARIFVLKNAKKQQGKFKRKEAGLAKWYKINGKGILGLIRHISLIRCLLSYRNLTRTWYKVQSSSKITVLSGYFSLQNLQSLILFESEYVQ